MYAVLELGSPSDVWEFQNFVPGLAPAKGYDHHPPRKAFSKVLCCLYVYLYIYVPLSLCLPIYIWPPSSTESILKRAMFTESEKSGLGGGYMSYEEEDTYMYAMFSESEKSGFKYIR